jgi:AcrR family transcriptional regulator
MERPVDGTRREEILETAARLLGATGFRTSVQEIAKACGILPGSLYHHFDSKEAILIELVKRYQAELDAIAAQALETLRGDAAAPILDQVIAVAEAVAACAARNRAALLQTFYEPPASAGDELIQLGRRAPTSIDNAILEILRAGQARRYIRRDLDLGRLAERIRQSTLTIGLLPGVRHIPALKCRMLIEGICTIPPEIADLDRSTPFAVAEEIIASWRREDDESRLGQLRKAARTEFGRRGFESTTIRDIAAAAGMSAGMVHHLAGSKDELVASILESYTRNVATSWEAVLASSGTPVEKIDAIIWLDINAMDQFSDEFKIQMGRLQQSPPESGEYSRMRRRPAQIKMLLREGERSGQFRMFGGAANSRAYSALELTWLSESIVRGAGPRGALSLARETFLRGAAVRS